MLLEPVSISLKHLAQAEASAVHALRARAKYVPRPSSDESQDEDGSHTFGTGFIAKSSLMSMNMPCIASRKLDMDVRKRFKEEEHLRVVRFIYHIHGVGFWYEALG